MHQFGSELRRKAQELTQLADEIDPPASLRESLEADAEQIRKKQSDRRKAG
jgi:hypothetical protein